MTVRSPLIVVMFLEAVLGLAPEARAHCDTLNGPVVSAARVALRTNDVTPVLKWVRQSEEAEIREAFRNTVAVRGLNAAAQELADRFFFETVVRLHRVGEGEPYTGLRAATAVDDLLESADRALLEGNVEPVVKVATDRVAAGIRERFARAREFQRHADESVAAGRRYVEAYVTFIHFVEEVIAHQAGEGDTHKVPDPSRR